MSPVDVPSGRIKVGEPRGGTPVSDVVVVVGGTSAVLCFTAVFALVFRPSDFRRHRAREAKPNRPARSGAPYVHSYVVLPPNWTPAPSKQRWADTSTSDVPHGQ
jgi:hypothetical protein